MKFLIDLDIYQNLTYLPFAHKYASQVVKASGDVWFPSTPIKGSYRGVWRKADPEAYVVFPLIEECIQGYN